MTRCKLIDGAGRLRLAAILKGAEERRVDEIVSNTLRVCTVHIAATSEMQATLRQAWTARRRQPRFFASAVQPPCTGLHSPADAVGATAAAATAAATPQPRDSATKLLHPHPHPAQSASPSDH